MFRTKRGQSVLQRIALRVHWWKARVTRSTVYIAEPLSGRTR